MTVDHGGASEPPLENRAARSVRTYKSGCPLRAIRLPARIVFYFLAMASARWSKASSERHGVDDKYPAVGHVVADLLSLVLVRRGSRSENITVNKEDFVQYNLQRKVTTL